MGNSWHWQLEDHLGQSGGASQFSRWPLHIAWASHTMVARIQKRIAQESVFQEGENKNCQILKGPELAPHHFCNNHRTSPDSLEAVVVKVWGSNWHLRERFDEEYMTILTHYRSIQRHRGRAPKAGLTRLDSGWWGVVGKSFHRLDWCKLFNFYKDSELTFSLKIGLLRGHLGGSVS